MLNVQCYMKRGFAALFHFYLNILIFVNWYINTIKEMEDSKITSTPGKKKSHLFRNLLIILLIVVAGIFTFFYFGIYDEGVRAGSVVRVSKKGIIFKTYEGQLNLQSFGALKGASTFAETFDFSVEKKKQDVIRELEAVALSGERVNLHYIKRYNVFPWRGDTKYFVTSVERTGERPFTE